MVILHLHPFVSPISGAAVCLGVPVSERSRKSCWFVRMFRFLFIVRTDYRLLSSWHVRPETRSLHWLLNPYPIFDPKLPFPKYWPQPVTWPGWWQEVQEVSSKPLSRRERRGNAWWTTMMSATEVNKDFYDWYNLDWLCLDTEKQQELNAPPWIRYLSSQSLAELDNHSSLSPGCQGTTALFPQAEKRIPRSACPFSPIVRQLSRLPLVKSEGRGWWVRAGVLLLCWESMISPQESWFLRNCYRNSTLHWWCLCPWLSAFELKYPLEHGRSHSNDLITQRLYFEEKFTDEYNCQE